MNDGDAYAYKLDPVELRGMIDRATVRVDRANAANQPPKSTDPNKVILIEERIAKVEESVGNIEKLLVLLLQEKEVADD